MDDASLAVRARGDGSEQLIAFARVFSGTLRRGDRVHILGPRHAAAVVIVLCVVVVVEVLLLPLLCAPWLIVLCVVCVCVCL